MTVVHLVVGKAGEEVEPDEGIQTFLLDVVLAVVWCAEEALEELRNGQQENVDVSD